MYKDFVKRLRDKAVAFENNEYPMEVIVQDYRDCASLIEYLSEQPQAGKWIPVEEDMPMIDEYALVQDDEERIFIACIDSLDGEWRTNCHHVLRRGSVISWQPLPQPHKKEGELNG